MITPVVVFGPHGSASAASPGIDTPGAVRNANWYLSNSFGGNGDHIFVFGNPGDVQVVGDWNGDGFDTPGVFRNATWYLSDGYNGSVDYAFVYGLAGDTPVVGDWNGDGRDTMGIMRGDQWHLSDSLGGAANYVFAYGIAGDKAVVGDWNGDGRDTPGVVRGHTWFLSNSFGGTGDYIFGYGNDSDLAIAGDWDANGTDTPGVVRGDEWWLSNDFSGGVATFFKYGIAGDRMLAGHFAPVQPPQPPEPPAEFSFVYGNPTDRPVMGDWNGDGIDTPGVIRGDRWLLSNTFNATVDLDFAYGIAGDKLVVGDWNGDGIDTPGVVRGHIWFLSNSFGGTGDYIFGYGNDSDLAIVGDWDGNGTDTPAVIRGDEWWLSNDFSGGVATFFKYGIAGDKFVAGDWDIDGVDSPGAIRNATWYLSNIFGGTGDFIFNYGLASDTPFAGDFDNDEVDTFGVWRAGTWYVRNRHIPPTLPPDEPPGIPNYDEPVEDYTDAEAGVGLQAVMPVWARYAPEVRLHPDERNWPARVGPYFLANSGLKWSFNRTSATSGLKPEPWRLGLGSGTRSYFGLGCTASRVFRAWEVTRPYESGRAGCLGVGAQGFFLDLDNDFRAGEPNNLGNVPVYYEFLSGKYVQYYFFYANDNAFPLNIADHEGDWERIVIRLSPTNTPLEVAYYFHNCPFLRRDWPVMPKVDNNGIPSASGTHLVVWAARGTHGSWPEVGDGQRQHCSPLGIGDDHLSDAGRRWRTWRRMVNVFQAPWYGFGGAWGERGLYTHTTGPLGPYPGKKLPPPGWGP